MRNSKAFVPSATPSWFPEELKKLKAMAAAGCSVEAISSALKRTPSAVRNKAGMHGISLSRTRPRATASIGEAPSTQ